MQKEGTPRFLTHHQGPVRAVAYHPTDRHLFCSGGTDGRVNLYSALRCDFLMSYQLTTMTLARNVIGVRFTSDGSKILATTTARRLTVIDVEHGEQLMSYEACAFNGRDRTGIATDPLRPHMAVCCTVNGKGLTIFDLRMPLPLDFMYDLHSSIIRDVCYLDSSWPWGEGTSTKIASVSVDGMLNVHTLDGRCVMCIDAGHSIYSVTPIPEPYVDVSDIGDDGFPTWMLMAGDLVTSYLPPDNGIAEILRDHGDAHVWKARYTSTGSFLYTGDDKGVIRRYRRHPDHHQYLGEVFRHTADVQDMDVSPYDEYLVTASKDKSVGVIVLGSPNHGSTEYSEFT